MKTLEEIKNKIICEEALILTDSELKSMIRKSQEGSVPNVL